MISCPFHQVHGLRARAGYNGNTMKKPAANLSIARLNVKLYYHRRTKNLKTNNMFPR